MFYIKNKEGITIIETEESALERIAGGGVKNIYKLKGDLQYVYARLNNKSLDSKLENRMIDDEIKQADDIRKLGILTQDYQKVELQGKTLNCIALKMTDFSYLAKNKKIYIKDAKSTLDYGGKIFDSYAEVINNSDRLMQQLFATIEDEITVLLSNGIVLADDSVNVAIDESGANKKLRLFLKDFGSISQKLDDVKPPKFIDENNNLLINNIETDVKRYVALAYDAFLDALAKQEKREIHLFKKFFEQSSLEKYKGSYTYCCEEKRLYYINSHGKIFPLNGISSKLFNILEVSASSGLNSRFISGITIQNEIIPNNQHMPEEAKQQLSPFFLSNKLAQTYETGFCRKILNSVIITITHLSAEEKKKRFSIGMKGEASADQNDKNNDDDQENMIKSLLDASDKGDRDTIQRLLEKGVSVSEKESHNGYTALHLAAHNGDRDTIEFLLERGANINQKDHDGATPLHWAAYGNGSSVINFLLEKGANMNGKDNSGTTALQYLLPCSDINILNLFLKNALDKKDEKNIELLLKNGANVISLVKKLLQDFKDKIEIQKNAHFSSANFFQPSEDKKAAAALLSALDRHEKSNECISLSDFQKTLNMGELSQIIQYLPVELKKDLMIESTSVVDSTISPIKDSSK